MRAAYCLFTDLTLNWSREDIDIDGSLIAQRLEDGITMTSSPVMKKQVPVRPSELSVFLDTTSGALGTTKLTRVLSGEFNIGNRFKPVWVVDRAPASFVSHVESEPEVTFKMTQMANSEGMSHLTRMRAGDTCYVRLHAVGPKIQDQELAPEGVLKHEMMIDVACQVGETNNFSDEDGVYAVEWGLTSIYDANWGSGKAFKVTVITTLSSL